MHTILRLQTAYALRGWRFFSTSSWVGTLNFLGGSALLLAVAAAKLQWIAPLSFGPWNPPYENALPFALGTHLLVMAYLISRNRVKLRLQRFMQLMTMAQEGVSHELLGPMHLRALTLHDVSTALTRFAAHAQEAYARCRTLQHELETSRLLMQQLSAQHATLVASTNREIVEQYQHVLAYAHYLDEHIQARAPDAQLRYDFDDVCESSFNLKLIATAMEILRHGAQPFTPVPLTTLLQQTVLALAPSLDRRAMKLSSLGVDEQLIVHTDLPALAHAVWIMLLGIIRFAADESTLRLRCLELAQNDEVMLSIVVSELSPGQLSREERHAHLARQLPHSTPHMFAETVRMHGNVQLAQLLLEPLSGRLTILPITEYACEICLFLPSAKK